MLPRTPRAIDVEITAKCNLACAYCYFFENSGVTYQDLPTEEWLRFFEECGKLGIMRVSLAGGEPFLREDLRLLLQAIVDNRMRYSLLSNGGLISDGMAAFIAGTKRCDYMQISIDGAEARTHDACRGKGSWKKAVRGIKILQRHGVPVTARVTINRYNVDQLEAIADFFLEDLRLNSFGTNAAGYLGSCRGNSKDILLTTDQRQQAMEALVRVEQKYPGRILAEAGPLAEAHLWSEMEEAKAEHESGSRGRLMGCGCTFEQIAVRSDGTIVPCCMLPHIGLGRINRDSLADIWLNSVELRSMRERTNICLSDIPYCAGCEYVSHCTGNCPGLAYSITGEVNHPSPDACYRNFVNAGGKLPANA